MFSLMYLLLSLTFYTMLFLLSCGERGGDHVVLDRLENGMIINNDFSDGIIDSIIDGKGSSRSLSTDPLTAAVFATFVTQSINFATSNSCDGFFNHFCERVKIKINNHFCNVELKKQDQKYFDRLEASADLIISSGSGQSGGEFYGTYITKGVVRYKININNYKYYLDFFWCIDCEHNYYYSDLDTTSPKGNLNGYGVAILDTNGHDIDKSFHCYETLFLNEFAPGNDAKIDVPDDCGHWKGKYGPLSIYTTLAGTKTISYQSAGNGVGIKISSEMTEVEPRVLTLDVFPYDTSRKVNAKYCPS